MEHPAKDYLSLLLCGYIGARCVLLKYPALPHAGGAQIGKPSVAGAPSDP